MESLKSTDKETIALQLKSLFIFEFLKDYNEFETLTRTIFESSLGKVSNNFINKLYYMYGGRISTYFEYENPSIKMNNKKYQENEKFSELTVNQILKICKVNKEVDGFEFEIESIQHPKTVYIFIDCALKLLNMRNKLAHEMIDLEFKDKDLIELLAMDRIKEEAFLITKNFDIENMDDMTQYIASNTIYLRRINQSLRERIC